MEEFNSGNTNIIFCLSYLNIPSTVSIIEKSRGYLVITHNPGIHKLLVEFYGGSNIELIESPIPMANFKLFKKLKLISSLKKRYWDKLSEFNNSNVHVFFVAHAYMETWLVRKLSVKNNIIRYARKNPLLTNAKGNLKTVINGYLITLVYGVPLSLNLAFNRPIHEINEKYFEEVGAKVFPLISAVSEEFTKKLTSKFVLSGVDVLFLTGGVIETELISSHTYQKLVDQILPIVGAQKLVIKPHPRFPQLFGSELKMRSLPGHLPANLLGDAFQIVIGFHSAVLYELANQGKRCISLLDLLDSGRSELIDNYKNYLNARLEGDNVIHFPKSVDDLEELLRM